MPWIRQGIDLFLHLDTYLAAITHNYGSWSYLLLFVVVFCETGLVVTPFLPGDSLLFAAGALSAKGAIDVEMLFSDPVRRGNFGRHRQLLDRPPRRPAGLSRQRPLPEKRTPRPHPQVLRAAWRQDDHPRPLHSHHSHLRTFRGGDRRNELWSIHRLQHCRRDRLGGSFLFGGYYFGGLPIVKERFSLVILAIILISVLPIVVEYVRARLRRPRDGGNPAVGALPLPPEEGF